MTDIALCLRVSRRPLCVLRTPGTVRVTGMSESTADVVATTIAGRLNRTLAGTGAGAVLVPLGNGAASGALEPVSVVFRCAARVGEEAVMRLSCPGG